MSRVACWSNQFAARPSNEIIFCDVPVIDCWFGHRPYQCGGQQARRRRRNKMKTTNHTETLANGLRVKTAVKAGIIAVL
jgi:hypothetical protein